MLGNEAPRGRRRRRFRSSRRLRVFLFAVGICGLAMGAGLLVGGLHSGSARLRMFGVLYLLASAVLLAVGKALERIDQLRKRKLKRRA